MKTPFRSILVAGMLALVLAACGGSPAAAPTATPVPPTATPVPPTAPPVQPTAAPVSNSGTSGDTSETLLAALNKTKEITTYQIEMDFTGKGNFGTELPGVDPNTEVSLFTISGKFDGADSQFTLKGLIASFLGADADAGIEIIAADGQNYIRGPLPLLGATEEKWYILDENSSSIAQPPVGSGQILEGLTGENADFSGLTKTGSETIDGVSCDIYTGDKEATLKALGSLGSDTLPTPSNEDDIQAAEVQFWACQDGYFRQMRLTMEGSETDATTGTAQPFTIGVLLRLFDFNGDITVTAPSDAAPLETPSFDMPTPQP